MPDHDPRLPMGAAPPPPPSPSAPPSTWSAPSTGPATFSRPPALTPQPAEALAGRAQWARIAIVVNLVATVGTIGASIVERRVLVDIRDGVFVSTERAESSDRLVMWMSIAFVATFVFAIVMFLRWFSRAYKNLATWRTNEHSSGWAVGAWFVPFLNLFRPYKITEEIMMASPVQERHEAPRILHVWWSAFLLSSLIDRFLLRQRDDTVEAYINQGLIGMLSSVIWVVAGVAILRIIAEVTRIQDERISPGSPLIS